MLRPSKSRTSLSSLHCHSIYVGKVHKNLWQAIISLRSMTSHFWTCLETLLLWLHTAKEELVLDDAEESDSTFDTSWRCASLVLYEWMPSTLRCPGDLLKAGSGGGDREQGFIGKNGMGIGNWWNGTIWPATMDSCSGVRGRNSIRLDPCQNAGFVFFCLLIGAHESGQSCIEL